MDLTPKVDLENISRNLKRAGATSGTFSAFGNEGPPYYQESYEYERQPDGTFRFTLLRRILYDYGQTVVEYERENEEPQDEMKLRDSHKYLRFFYDRLKYYLGPQYQPLYQAVENDYIEHNPL